MTRDVSIKRLIVDLLADGVHRSSHEIVDAVQWAVRPERACRMKNVQHHADIERRIRAGKHLIVHTEIQRLKRAGVLLAINSNPHSKRLVKYTIPTDTEGNNVERINRQNSARCVGAATASGAGN